MPKKTFLKDYAVIRATVFRVHRTWEVSSCQLVLAVSYPILLRSIASTTNNSQFYWFIVRANSSGIHYTRTLCCIEGVHHAFHKCGRVAKGESGGSLCDVWAAS